MLKRAPQRRQAGHRQRGAGAAVRRPCACTPGGRRRGGGREVYLRRDRHHAGRQRPAALGTVRTWLRSVLHKDFYDKRSGKAFRPCRSIYALPRAENMMPASMSAMRMPVLNATAAPFETKGSKETIKTAIPPTTNNLPPNRCVCIH